MDKLKLAHDYALKQMESLSENSTMQSLVSVAWQYADAMQAEAEKRENKERPDVLKEEWQPDWSQAPVWANWWTMDADSAANWLSDHPSSDPLKIKVWTAPSFDYQGNWKNSLRKRPQ